jgi:hypothetical protein
MDVNSKCVSLICSAIVNKIEVLKHNVLLHQAIFSKPVNKARVATIASYKIREVLAKKMMIPFENGNVKECLVMGDD